MPSTAAIPPVNLRRASSGPIFHCNGFDCGGVQRPFSVKRGLPKRSQSVSRLVLAKDTSQDEHTCESHLFVPSSECQTATCNSRHQTTDLTDISIRAKDFVQERAECWTKSYKLCNDQLLGEGAFGNVFVALDRRTGLRRAMKILDKSHVPPSEYHFIRNEFQIQKDLDHPCISRIYHFLESPKVFCICMDICRGGDLYDEVADHGQLSEPDAAIIMKQVLSTLKYLHERKIAHRDIALENILLESHLHFEKLKIADFGLATTLQAGEKHTTMCGKIHYVAPQVWRKSYDAAKYDVWQCGVVVFTLLAGFAPFDGHCTADIRDQIMAGTPQEDPATWSFVSVQAKEFVQSLLTHDEDSRPSAEETLRHPWIEQAIQTSQQTFRRRSSDSAAGALENMRTFSATTKLKELFCTFIASHLLDVEEKEDADMIFQAMDLDCDGKLSYDEIQQGYNQYFHENLNEDELKSLFRRIDLDGSGYVEFSEFLIASIGKNSLLSEKRLQACFNLLDKEGSGYLSTQGLRRNLTAIDGDALDCIMFQAVDDGRLSFDRFREVMLSSQSSPPQ